jgi:hypothetical protein
MWPHMEYLLLTYQLRSVALRCRDRRWVGPARVGSAGGTPTTLCAARDNTRSRLSGRSEGGPEGTGDVKRNTG